MKKISRKCEKKRNSQLREKLNCEKNCDFMTSYSYSWATPLPFHDVTTSISLCTPVWLSLTLFISDAYSHTTRIHVASYLFSYPLKLHLFISEFYQFLSSSQFLHPPSFYHPFFSLFISFCLPLPSAFSLSDVSVTAQRQPWLKE